MKRVIAFVLVIVLFASLCGCFGKKPSGLYIAYIEGIAFSSYDFSAVGSKVTVEYITGVVKEGTWEMDGNTVTLQYEDGGYDEFTYDPDSDTLDIYGVATASKD